MRRNLAALGTVVLILAGCGSHSTSIDASGIKTLKPGVITACSDIPYEPFFIGDANNLSGIEPDLLNAMATKMKMKVEFVNYSFPTLFDQMNSGKCDVVMSSVSITPERQQSMLFTDGYFEISQSLLVRSEQADMFPSLDALKGHKVAVQDGTTGEAYIREHGPGIIPVPLDGTVPMVSAIRDKTVDAVVQDYPVNSYYAKIDPRLKVVRPFTDVQREEYGIALPLKSTQLRDALNKELKEVRKDGTYSDILKQYLGTTSDTGQ